MQSRNPSDFVIAREAWNSNAKINTHTRLDGIKGILSKLSDEEIRSVKNGVFGHLLEIENSAFPGKIVHQLLLRQCHAAKTNELAFNFNGQIAKFGIREFAICSGLLCKHNDDTDDIEATPQVTIVEKFFNNKTASVNSLLTVFNSSLSATSEEKVKLANLCILYTQILPCQHSVSSDPKYLELADYPDRFANYPWGLESFRKLLETMKKHRTLKTGKLQAYDAGGFVHALVVWAYETIPLLLERGFATKLRTMKLPRILRWNFNLTPSFFNLSEEVFDNPAVRFHVLLLENMF